MTLPNPSIPGTSSKYGSALHIFWPTPMRFFLAQQDKNLKIGFLEQIFPGWEKGDLTRPKPISHNITRPNQVQQIMARTHL